MLKKTQQYLLLNYPLLWNMRVLLALLCAVVINILFFVGGYLLTEIDFTNTYYYSEDSFLVYVAAVLCSILSFIIWMVFYSKNNAFQSFYPKSSGGLYLEWVLTFVIVAGFVLYPLSYYEGTKSKIKSYVDKSEMIHAIETLNMIRMLIPYEEFNYYADYSTDSVEVIEHNVIPGDAVKKTETVEKSEFEVSDSVDNNLGSFDLGSLSLLNYKSDASNVFYTTSEEDFTVRDGETVKQWLKDQDKEKVSKLMDDFIALQNKHKLSMNFTKEQWLKMVYNPPRYPVGEFNLITPRNYKTEPGVYNVSKYYVSYRELVSAYDEIKDAYSSKESTSVLYISAAYLILAISLFVFSYRVTSGKSWLIALVAMGLMLFINGILSFLVYFTISTGYLFYALAILAIFAVEIVLVIKKNMERKAKGRSEIYMNHLIWFVPAVPLLLFWVIYMLTYPMYPYADNPSQYEIDSLVYLFIDKHISEFIIGNIFLTFFSMWLFIRTILRKWKSLPEQ